MTLQVDSNQTSPQAITDAPESYWQTAIKVIAQIALHILIPSAAAYLSYLLLPASYVAIGMPLITVCTVFIVAFFSIGQKSLPFGQTQLPPFAPRGMDNGGMNCWINSLAQTLRCDEDLMDWFHDFPGDAWERMEALPLLPPQFFSDDLEDDELFDNDEPPEDYLAQMHPRLNNPVIANARSYYRDYCGGFEGTDQEFLAHIRAPEFVANLYAQDRQKIETYFDENPAGVCPYFEFFAEIAPAQRLARKNAIVEFQNFLVAYETAQDENLPKVNFSSQRLRVALSNLNPLIDANARVQLDPMEAFTAISQLLAPRDLRVSVERRTIYDRGQNPPMEGGEESIRREDLELPYIQLPLRGSQPTVQTLYAQAVDAENGETLARSRAVDGREYEYVIERQKMQFVEAPSNLWLHVIRMANVQHSGWECLQRLMPCWFSKRVVNQSQKLDTPIAVEPILTLDPDGEDQYQLDGFIIHHGSSLQSGHYTACQRVEVEDGRFVWFETNDRSVRELSEEEALGLASQAYAYHYSEIL